VGVYRTIRGIPQAAWDACFPGDPEGWAYYRAVEESRLEAFSWLYLAARDGDRVLAVVPAFITDYGLDTTIQGGLRAALRPLLLRFKSRLTLRLLCLGSPLADKCHLGFAPDLPAERYVEVAGRLLESLDAFAAGHRIGLLGAKDIAESELVPGVGAAFAAAGFNRQPGLPNAVLTLPDGGEDAYLRLLSNATRRDIRRKMKSMGLVSVEAFHGQDALGLVAQISRLYEGQRRRSSVDFDQFEKLTPEYFRQVLARQAKTAVVFLYTHQDRPVAFNLCFHTERMFIDKFIGFQPPLARALNLYVLSWMTNVRYCLARGIPYLQTGQTSYAMKRHMGSEFRSNWIFFKHRNSIVNFALRLASPLLAADRYDDELTHPSGRAS